MSIKSFLLKSLGGISLFLAMLPAVRLILRSQDDTALITAEFAGAVVILVGLGVGLFIASSDRSAAQAGPQVSFSAPRPPATPRSAQRQKEDRIIAFIVVFFVTVACLILVTLFHGDTAADRDGINTLWWCVERLGIPLLVCAALYIATTIGRGKSNSRDPLQKPPKENPVNSVKIQ